MFDAESVSDPIAAVPGPGGAVFEFGASIASGEHGADSARAATCSLGPPEPVRDVDEAGAFHERFEFPAGRSQRRRQAAEDDAPALQLFGRQSLARIARFAALQRRCSVIPSYILYAFFIRCTFFFARFVRSACLY